MMRFVSILLFSVVLGTSVFSTTFLDNDSEVETKIKRMQFVLEREKRLEGETQLGSYKKAYSTLDKYLEKLVPGGINPARISALSMGDREIFKSITKTLARFVAWNPYAPGLMAELGINRIETEYEKHISLLEHCQSYCTTDVERNNSKVTYLRLMRMKNQTLAARGQASSRDPETMEMYQMMFDILEDIKTGSRLRYLEQAILIVDCGHSPTGDREQDLVRAKELKELMDKSSSPQRKFVANIKSSSKKVRGRRNTNAHILGVAVPYMNQDSMQTRAIRNKTKELLKAIAKEKEQVRDMAVVSLDSETAMSSGEESAVIGVGFMKTPLESSVHEILASSSSDSQMSRSLFLESDEEEDANQKHKKRKQIVISDDEEDVIPDAIQKKKARKSPVPALTPEQQKALRQLALNRGQRAVTNQKLADEIGGTKNQVKNYVSRHPELPRKNTTRLNKHQKQRIKELLSKDEEDRGTYQQIADEVGCNEGQVSYFVRSSSSDF